MLALLYVTDISFCILFIINGFDHYFPFMVPAIALAPVYWIGITLLSKPNYAGKRQ